MNWRIAMALTRLLRRPAAHPSPGHRARLEQDLLARFGELHPQSTKERTMPVMMLRRAALVGGLLLAAGGASQAPADVKAEIGKRIEVTSQAPLGRPDVEAIVQALQGGGRRFEVRVKVERRDAGPVTTAIELFGDTVRLEDVAATIKKAVPALAALPIQVTNIERTVQGDLGEVAGKLVGRDPKLSPQALQKAIEAELRAKEPGADVDVKVEDKEGKREVQVRVTRTTEGEAPAAQPAPPPAPPARP